VCSITQKYLYCGKNTNFNRPLLTSYLFYTIPECLPWDWSEKNPPQSGGEEKAPQKSPPKADSQSLQKSILRRVAFGVHLRKGRQRKIFKIKNKDVV